MSLFKKEPAVVIGAVFSVLAIVAQVAAHSLDVAGALAAVGPIVAGIFIRSQVSPTPAEPGV